MCLLLITASAKRLPAWTGLSKWSPSTGDVGGQPASWRQSRPGLSCTWHVQKGVGGWMKHTHESECGHKKATYNDRLSAWAHNAFTLLLSVLSLLKKTWMERIRNKAQLYLCTVGEVQYIKDWYKGEHSLFTIVRQSGFIIYKQRSIISNILKEIYTYKNLEQF